ncbi:probable mediator of RNA polymerase II transcription subunit 26a [Phragmites australis]|uniref:probable mediator of RNA polymerase II transcription subunit 26a n=1 Tax=Phragmites australis TaxID=29695 RepID=UPI002D76B3D7|nr:probable mediator of RNA polymerase II transcription subunit 26a [Phragmites australis]
MADGLDRWREFFRGTGAGICDVIENSILVAAADAPRELLHRRDRIAERLFTAHRLDAAAPPPSLGSVAASATPATPVEEDKGSVRRVAEKESKVDSSSNGAHVRVHGHDEDDDSDSDDERLRRAAASNYGHNYDDDDDNDEEEDEQQAVEEEQEEEEDHEAQELEALTNEIDEESQVVGEVLRIKELLLHKEDHSDATLFESLRRLQLMQLSVSTLKATEIGRAVNLLRKHNSQQIRHLVRTLIEGWKVLVDEWVNTTNAALADNSPGSSNPSVVDEEEEEGLPSPPLDEGAFFATQTTSIQLSEFFDEMDEDGNLRHNNDANLGNKRGSTGGRPANHSAVAKQEPPRPSPGAIEKVRSRRPELARQEQEPSMRQANPQKPQCSSLPVKPHGMLNKQSKPSSFESGPGRPLKAAPQQKPFGDMKLKQTRERIAVERKPTASQMDKSRLAAQHSAGVKLELAKPKICDDGLDNNRKLEAAKRRLQERYQEAENAKRQRTIQVMELGDIPKPKHQNRQPMVKSRNNIRNWANGRR